MGYLESCAAMRKQLGVDSLLHGEVLPREFRERFAATVPFSFHRTDCGGRPIMLSRYGQVDVAAFEHLWLEGEALAERGGLSTNACVLCNIRIMEYLTKVLMPQETARQERTVDRILHAHGR